MVFTVNVSSDLFQRKDNISIEFPARPTMSELTTACESLYDVATRGNRPAGAPDYQFKIQQFQYYDELSGSWTELYNQLQLADGCQVFAFQPANEGTRDVQAVVPPSRKVIAWVPTPGSSVPRCAVPGMEIPFTHRKDFVFHDICSHQKGAVTYWALRNTLLAAQIDVLSSSTLNEAFTRFDTDKDGILNNMEFTNFCETYPDLCDAMYYRCQDLTRTFPTVTAALDADLEHERIVMKELLKKEKIAKKIKQSKVVERLSAGKSAEVTNTEVRNQEKWIARLAELDRHKKVKAIRKKEQLMQQEMQNWSSYTGMGVPLSPTVFGGGADIQRAHIHPTSYPIPVPLMTSPLPVSPIPAPVPTSPTTPKRKMMSSPPLSPRKPSTVSTSLKNTRTAVFASRKGPSFASPGSSPKPTGRSPATPSRSTKKHSVGPLSPVSPVPSNFNLPTPTAVTPIGTVGVSSNAPVYYI